MPSNRFEEVRDYTFADQVLALRQRAGLTQRQLAAMLGVSRQAIRAWEAGLSYPAAAHLQQLIALYLERGALPAGREAEQAATLWEAARGQAARRLASFDSHWFASLRCTGSPAVPGASSPPRRHGWGEVPDVPALHWRAQQLATLARTTFVGRAADVAALTQVLVAPTTRLLTLSGLAGSGKTRLALQVAAAVRDAYADGVWLVELAPLPAAPAADPTAVVVAVLTALGLPEQPRQDLLDTLVAHLESRRLLLVLDNCEHVAAACIALTRRLLAACPQLQVLTTSQHPLGSAAETVWRVTPLAVPDPVAGTPTPAELHRLGQADAVQLFVERAQAVQPSFRLSAQNAGAVVTICRQVDGLPLAIELAAARLHVLPVAELLSRLDDRFRLLRRGGAPPMTAT